MGSGSIRAELYVSVLCAMFRWQTVGFTWDGLRDSPNKSGRQLITIHQWRAAFFAMWPALDPRFVA